MICIIAFSMTDRQNIDFNLTLFLVTKLSEVIDRTLVFKDDLIMAASETLSTIANKYKQKMQASKKKPSKMQKEKKSTILSTSITTGRSLFSSMVDDA